MRMLMTLAAAALAALPAGAQDFAEGSMAKSWNLYAERPALFEARVTDALCAITGDCPADCGGGRRQLVLIRSADDVVVFPNKNNQPAFTGAAAELLAYCGQRIEVDGLLIEDPDIGATNIYLVQRLRAVGAADWVTANRWTRDWAAANPDAAGPGPWFRRDPRIRADIAENGYFGLGLEADAAIIKELFE
ncbi:MAG: hypothetical protein ACK4TB_12235 [Gemmobacter sp.]